MNQITIKKNDIFPISITRMSTDGKGIGKTDNNFTIFVPETCVGDLINVKIVKVNKNYAFGIIDKIIEPSKSRIDSDCKIFSQCGGCSFRHMTYDEELIVKRDFVKSNLTRIGRIDTEVFPVSPSPQTDNYRNKAQYPIGTNANGEVLVGFYANRSHRIIDNHGCKLQPSFFQDIVDTVKEFITENDISTYDETNNKGLFRHLFIRYGKNTNQVIVCLVINGKNIPHADILVEKLLNTNNNIVSITVNINTENTNVILGKKIYNIYGKEHITDVLCNLSFDISALSFYQINHDAAENLYSIAATMADLKGNEILVDLYCGTGTIGLTMAHKVKMLIGVDVVPDAIKNAIENAKQNKVENAWFICGDAKYATAKLKYQRLSPDVVILDPPRKGCNEEVLNQVSLMSPSKIVMISCDSATLARDLKILTQLGYETKKVQPVDMFPRTPHVETVVLLSRISQ